MQIYNICFKYKQLLFKRRQTTVNGQQITINYAKLITAKL